MNSPAPASIDGLSARVRLGAAALLAAALVGAAFGPGLGNGFLFWDDRVYLHDNPYLHALTPTNLWWMLTDSVGPNAHYNWQPLTALSHALDLAWFGFDAPAHRAGNLVLHTVSSVAVFVIAWRVFRSPPLAEAWSAHRSFAAALLAMTLFSVHPLRVESVIWIAERKDVLCGALYLLAVASWLQFRVDDSRRWRVAASVFALGACLAKPMAVSLPLVLVLLDHWPHGRWRLPRWSGLRDNLLGKWDLLGYSVLTAVMAVTAQSSGGGIRGLSEVDVAVRAVNASHSLLLYPWKTLAPVGLTTLYPYPAHVTALSLVAWVELAVVAVLTGWSLWRLCNRASWWATLWLGYVLMLGPVLGLVQVGVQSSADRYTYLPMVGAAVLVATILMWPRWPSTARTGCVALSIAIPLVMVQQTRAQTLVWHSDRTLWEHALRYYPTQLPVAHVNLGNAYFRTGDIGAAELSYERALGLEPDNALTHANLAWVRLRLDAFDAALESANRAIALDNNSLQGWLSRAVAHQLKGQKQPAARAYQRVLELHPDNQDALRNLELLGLPSETQP